jgi:hypothetical protein
MLSYRTGARLARPLLIPLLLLTTFGTAHAREVYQKPEAFVAESFGGEIPVAKKLWLSGEIGEKYREIMHEPPPQLRLRYWQAEQRTVWVLQAIGKEHPITAGFIVEEGKMQLARVLVFRESRGWEIRYPFFTQQFRQLGLDSSQQLDASIDGITGATLSVRAMSNMARMALVLHDKVSAQHESP